MNLSEKQCGWVDGPPSQAAARPRFVRVLERGREDLFAEALAKAETF